MSLRRFFVASPLTVGSVALEGDEARHVAAVYRVVAGDVVTLFDGAGGVAEARVAAVGRGTVRCDIAGDIHRAAPPARAVELWCALPRAGAADDVVRLATEVGATVIRPLVTARGVWRPDDDAHHAGRFRKVAIAALKQCGGAWLPAVKPAVTVAAAEFPTGALAVVASLAPGAQPLGVALQSQTWASAIALVGPEGGFTPDEMAMLTARGAVPVTLGPRILRVETAVVGLLVQVVAAGA